MNYFRNNKKILVSLLLITSILGFITNNLVISANASATQPEIKHKLSETRLGLEEYVKLEKYVYDYILKNKKLIEPEKNESGFFRINLKTPTFINKNLNIEKLRIHYWPIDDSNKIQDESIHNHPKYFESFIVSGGYVHSIYKSNINRGKKFKLFKVNKNEKNLKTADNMGSVFLSKDKDETIKEGNIVVMPTNIIHRVLYSIPGSLSINVVYKDKNNKDYYNIMLTEKVSKKYIRTSREVIVGKLKEKVLNEIEKRLLNSIFQRKFCCAIAKIKVVKELHEKGTS